MKKCSSCQIDQPLAAFYRSTRTYDGLQTSCKACQGEARKAWGKQNRPAVAVLSKTWRTKNPRAAKDYGLRARYGLPLGTYDRMLAEQGGRCAICRTTEPGGKGGDFHVDHCHETKKVRGLLCNGCNVGLGYLKHSIEALASAISYLSEGSGVS